MRYRSHSSLSAHGVGSRNSRCLVATSSRYLKLWFVSMHNESNVHYEVDWKLVERQCFKPAEGGLKIIDVDLAVAVVIIRILSDPSPVPRSAVPPLSTNIDSPIVTAHFAATTIESPEPKSMMDHGRAVIRFIINSMSLRY